LKNILTFYHWKWPAQGTGSVPVVSAHFRSILVTRVSCTMIGCSETRTPSAQSLRALRTHLVKYTHVHFRTGVHFSSCCKQIFLAALTFVNDSLPQSNAFDNGTYWILVAINMFYYAIMAAKHTVQYTHVHANTYTKRTPMG